MSRRAANAKAKPDEEQEEDMEGSEPLDLAAETPPTASVPTLASPAPNGAPPYRSAKVRAEERKEAERDNLIEQLNDFTKGLDLNAGKYTFNLYRTEPKWHAGRVTGTDTGMLIATYPGKHPEIEEIMQEHGGEQYHFKVRGPNPEDPLKIKSWTFRLPRIAGAPKTVSTHNGTLPIDQAPIPNQQNSSDAALNLVRETTKMMVDKMEGTTKVIQDVLLARSQVPQIDPALQRAQDDAREERKQAHERELAKIKADAELAVSKSKQDAEEANRRRDEEREERKQAHELRLKEMELKSKEDDNKRAADAQARKDEAEARKEETKLYMKMMDDNRKATEAAVAKLADKLDDKNDQGSVIKQMLMMEDLKDRLTGRDKKDTGGSIADAVKDSIPKALDTIKFAIERIGGGPAAAPAQAQTRKQIAPGTVASVPVPGSETPPPPVVEQPAAAPATPLEFAFPTENTSPIESIQMLAANIEMALRSKWLAPQIFTDVVQKFPESVITVLKLATLDQAMDEIEKNAPGDAVLRSPRGKQAVRIIYGLLKQKAVP